MSEYESLPPSLDNRLIDPHVDLLSLLAAILKGGGEFLTTTWQPSLESLGEGATAEISQSLVNREIGFAFKRSHEDYSDQDSSSYKYVISEVRALQSSQVKIHPNVINLEGICWEVRDGKALPVLVFPKAEYGDLRSFVQSPLGVELGFGARLRLCIDVAQGLMVLHDSGIVHGDIKPQNVLIFPNPDGTVSAKISDLGYVAIGSDNDLTRLPRSRPWTDPDWNRREITIQNAKKMDVYSFGMICGWILFQDQLLEQLITHKRKESEISGATIFFPPNDAPESDLEFLQKTDELADTMSNLVLGSSEVGVEQVGNLVKFFRDVLCKDRQARTSDWRRIVTLLNTQSDDTSHTPPTSHRLDVDKVPHADFRIAACHYRLCTLDYRVRSTVFEALRARTNIEGKMHCQQCSDLACFQISVCYKLGFGVAKDDELSEHYLQLSTRTSQDLESELHRLKSRELDSTYTNSHFRHLFDQGHIGALSLSNRYTGPVELAEAEKVYSREIKDMQKVLGEAHSTILLLKSTLMTLLRERDKLEESEELGVKIVKAFQATMGKEHSDTIISMDNLSKTWVEQKNWPKACQIQEQIMSLRTSEQGPSHIATSRAALDLATTYRILGRLREAEELELSAIKQFITVLGQNHPETLEAMDRLSSTFLSAEKYPESLALRKYVVKAKSETLGKLNPSTIIAKCNLARTYSLGGRWQEAEPMFLENLESLRNVLGDLHDQTILCMEHLVRTYIRQGRFEDAVQKQLLVVDSWVAKCGKSHPTTLRSVSSLAEIYVSARKLLDADEAASRVLLHRKDLLASKHPEAMTALSNVAGVLLEQNRNQEAEALLRKVLDIEKQAYKFSSSNMISSLNSLALACSKQGRLNEAEELFSRARKLSTDLLGSDSEHTLEISVNFGSTLFKQGKFNEAENVFQTTRDICTQKFGHKHPKSIRFTEELSYIYRNTRRWKEAEPLVLELVEVSSETFGPLHLETLKQKVDLATVSKGLENWERAEKLFAEVYTAKKEEPGIATIEIVAVGAQAVDVLRKRNKWPEAVSFLQDMINQFNNPIGAEALAEKLLCMANLAMALAMQGNFNDAFDQHRRLISSLQNTSKESQWETTLDVLSNLAGKYADHKHWEESEELYAAVIQHAIDFLGLYHRSTLVSQSNLEAVRRERRQQP